MPYQYYQNNYPQYPYYPQYQYQNYPAQPMSQPVQQTVQQQPVQQTTPQIQNGGFVSVHDEDEARSYPVAPGNSVTFIDENGQYCYTKTQGFSQLDRPQFVKYKLIREDESVVSQAHVQEENKYALKDDLEAIAAQIKELRSDVDALYVKKPARKKEEADD